MRIRTLVISLLLIGILIPLSLLAQDDPTPEATPEATAEATLDSEATAEAAENCPAIVTSAIDLTQSGCQGTGTNQVCYGHLVLDAQARGGIQNFNFDLPGDIVDVIDVESLRLSALDVATGQWGVVLMEVGANTTASPSPDSADQNEDTDTEEPPEDDVQLLLFGDVELQDATVFLEVSAEEGGVNIRRRPSTSEEVIDSLEPGESITVNGRLDDSSWLRVRVVDEESGIGWIFADAVTTEGDIETLQPFTLEQAYENIPDELAFYGPMQAFYLQTGRDDAPCAEAPNSGILIQTPEGVASVSIWLDEVVVNLTDTAFIQASPDGNLSVNVLEGSATVEAMGDSRTAVAGQRIDVELDENLSPTGTPNDPVAIQDDDLQSLPTQLLDDEVDLPDPLSLASGVPAAGQWSFSWGVASLTCPDGTEVPFQSTGASSNLVVQSDGIQWSNLSYNRTADGIYQTTYTDGDGNLHQDTLQVIATDLIEGEKILDLVSPVCTLNVPFQLRLVGG